jgi:O-antigen/teichoic acid export membrane protein
MAKAYTPSNSRLMKNTILLYFRMALMMCINLYTSRIVLHTLGVEDYGIYNVVGGVIVMFSFINESMTVSTQRFLSFELGAGNKERLHEVFVTSLHIHIIISLIVVFLGETIGLWFVLEKMVIPPERMVAALWCYQLSIFTAVLTVLSYPYMSAIITHEKMSSFAYIAILDAVLKLLLVYLLLLFSYDKLILYAVLYVGEKLVIRMVYNIYCIQHFEECKYQWLFRKDVFKKMASFAGWSMFGNLAYVCYTQGLDILLNVFFGPIVNAARAVAVQVQGAVGQLADNFRLAINPQITKTYASNQLNEMHQLIFRGTRFTFCLLLLICLPLIFQTPMILHLWLKEVPDGSVIFIRLLLVILMLQQVYSPLVTAVAATGKIKRYESMVSVLMLTIIPISYIVLRFGGPPQSVFIVYLAIVGLSFATILYIVLPMINLHLVDYFEKAIRPCILVLSFSLFVSVGIKLIIPTNMLISFLAIILTIISTGFWGFVFGLEKDERNLIVGKIKKLRHK